MTAIPNACGPTRRVAVLACAAVLLGLGACAPLATVGGDVAAPEPPWADGLFAAPAQPPRAGQALALSPAMAARARQLRAAAPGGLPTARMLVEALSARGELRLDYDAQITRTAAQAFDDRAGNCLSLVLMTAAFARELGLPVSFNEALVEAQWRREGDLLMRSGHVNLTLGPPVRRGVWRSLGDESLMVDFLPGVDLAGLPVRGIDERRVLAMYLNNRAAEFMAAGDLATAYWWAREALRLDAAYAAARNTLGVVYQRAGQTALAAQVYEQLLAGQPDDSSALGNLAQVRLAQGRPDEAARLRARRDALEPPEARALRELSEAKLAWLKARARAATAAH